MLVDCTQSTEVGPCWLTVLSRQRWSVLVDCTQTTDVGLCWLTVLSRQTLVCVG